ncbi:MAG: hypothetical protein M4579_002342 [Chaenotheca gracillima]|nr:MAG: hypothetical protein M4579_002342 [Chaenotheca gracillima]
MPGPSNTLLIEGPFEELADELALYLDNVKKGQGDESSNVQAEIAPLLEQSQKDEVLKKLVTSSVALNAAPEKEFTASYNLLIHLIRQSDNVEMFLPKVCQNLSKPITSAGANGPGMALSTLTTIFNIMQPDDETRYNVFLEILRVVRNYGLWELIKPQLKNLDRWIIEWESDEEDQRKLFLEIASVARDVGEDEAGYQYVVRALRTFSPSESSTPQAQALALRALNVALSQPNHFDFYDLTSTDSIQALRKSSPIAFELLEIFNAKQLDDYDDFTSEHNDFLESQELDDAVLRRKMRLLTLASLAASTPSRSLPYASIARALQVPGDDVEMWVIDVIRAGLVEGRLSQLEKTFLVHRSTYRVFGEKQWREVATRLDTWKESLKGVLAVVKAEREHVEMVKDRDVKDFEGRQGGFGQGRRPPREMDIGLE